MKKTCRMTRKRKRSIITGIILMRPLRRTRKSLPAGWAVRKKQPRRSELDFPGTIRENLQSGGIRMSVSGKLIMCRLSMLRLWL